MAPTLDDPTIEDASQVRRVLLCSGKIRWELMERRRRLGLGNQVAIIALERLYPMPSESLAAILRRYRHIDDVRFVQDEPANQGAWPFLSAHLAADLAQHLPDYALNMVPVTRAAASAPSVGSLKAHKQQEEDLMRRALED